MGTRHLPQRAHRKTRQLQSEFGGRRQKSYGRIEQSSARPLAHGAAQDAHLWHANSAHQGLDESNQSSSGLIKYYIIELYQTPE